MMPAFRGSNCSLKTIIFVFFSISISLSFIYISLKLGGFILAALVMLLSLVINSYIIGKFGDNLFKNVDYRIEKAKLNEYQDKEFNFHNK